MRKINLETAPYIIDVGKSGEHDAQALQIDTSKLRELYGSGSLSALYQRSDGCSYYLSSDIDQETSICTIKLRSADTISGLAKLEIVWANDGVIAKTKTYTLRISESLAETGFVTDYAKEYLDQVISRQSGASNAEVLTMLSDLDWLPAITSGGEILTDENGSILLW